MNLEMQGKWIELGCGVNPTPGCTVYVDVRPLPGVTHFTVDFVKMPWVEIGSDEFDGAICKFVLEHIPYPKVRAFLDETYRILKPGGRAVFVLPDTEAQARFILDHPDGYDGKGLFEAASCHLFGDQEHGPGGGVAVDAQIDAHKAYFSQAIAVKLFTDACFENIKVQPFGERATDIIVEATRPAVGEAKMVKQLPTKAEPEVVPVVSNMAAVPDLPTVSAEIKEKKKQASEIIRTIQQGLPKTTVVSEAKPAPQEAPVPAPPVPADPLPPPEKLFDRDYFNKGKFGGGYAGMGYLDFPCHDRTAQLVLARQPSSVLEIGCGRGYVLKRLQDAGVRAWGSDVSRHCYLTRACEGVRVWDVCKAPWEDNARNEIGGQLIDLCLSIAVLELIPEEHVPIVVKEMARTCKRGLHGIDFGPSNGADRTKINVKPRSWWVDMFGKHAPGWPVELLPKDELEAGPIPEHVLKGDGKVKLNIGCAWTMAHHGWVNVDVLDQSQFASHFGYSFRQVDVRSGLPWQTGTVDLIACHHMIEHVNYTDGIAFLRDCRRILKPEGAMRISVPDADKLNRAYINSKEFDDGVFRLSEFDQLNENAARCKTAAAKLQSLLHDGHLATYDQETLLDALLTAGFLAVPSTFRQYAKEGHEQIGRETLDMLPEISLFIDAVPKTV